MSADAYNQAAKPISRPSHAQTKRIIVICDTFGMNPCFKTEQVVELKLSSRSTAQSDLRRMALRGLIRKGANKGFWEWTDASF